MLLKKIKKILKLNLLTTNKNIKKIYKQAIEFNVKKIVIFDKKKF